MKIELGPENAAAAEKLPPKQPDGSLIGINHTDAYLKAIKHEFEDGGKVTCKRKGIRLTLKIKDREGKGLMRRFVHGPDPKNILVEALKEAATDADAVFSLEDGVMWLDVN